MDMAKQLLVFFGAAGIGTEGGWGPDVVLRACCKVVCWPRGKDQRRGRVVLVDEHRTSRWPHASPHRLHAAARQPHSQKPQSLGPALPPAKRSKRTEAEQAAEPTQPVKGKGKAKGKATTAKVRWLDRDCNAALNMQRIGDSKWRPLELCWRPEQAALLAKGKEYPELGYKQVRDRPPKAQQQQQQPAEAQ
ncbi:hypothetical protein QJQ45_004897 [Haematococcus lacustris]|nr:hypothetical protein QJQ45_004897 [Haematococcus lacustris]